MPRRSPRTTAAFAVAALLAPLAWVASPADPVAAAEPRSATLVGSLQSELGCSADWQPTCEATVLAPTAPGATTYRATFDVPAGSHEFKVAIDRSFDESYGPDATKDNGKLVLVGPASVAFAYDDETHRTTVASADLPGGTVTAADRALADDSLRTGLTKENYYFVMADRFANGNRANDTGGLTGGRLESGFDPTDKGFYHGGDLQGLTSKLDYIKGLGTTSIWLTPSFKNRPVQGTGENASAGYHGYWITDFTQIDPHLGTNADMKALIDRAHGKGMKVFFDIITNHTADVLDYADPTFGDRGEADAYKYVDKATSPYTDAAGNTFDDKEYADGDPPFPALDPETSFPYVPTFRTEADRTVKVPAWLNDPTLYHNRGNSTFAGESTEYGDFSGLDDLFTENPRVTEGMIDIYKAWVDLGIDGFRIDTVKHVNLESWQKFSPAILAHAKTVAKNDDFFMFGEVFDSNPAFMSTYTTAGKLQATLDFGFQAAAQSLAAGKATTGMRDLFAGDDYYTDPDSNAYSLPTFLGNHDMGRLSMMLTGAGFTGAERVRRLQLAHRLMYLTRGNPVVYYGDEQGFVGEGGDKDARQDMFATRTDDYIPGKAKPGDPAFEDEEYLFDDGAPRDRYRTDTPLYRTIRQAAALRKAHPALVDGAQIPRYASPEAGIFAFSRIDPRTKVEYLVAVNNSTTAKTADFETFSRKMTYRPLSGARKAVRSRDDGRVRVTVPGLGVSVWRARGPVAGSPTAPTLYARTPGSGGDYDGRAEISAALGNDDFAQVSFAYRAAGTEDWTPLGTDDNVPFRVFHDVSGVPDGTLVEYRVVAKDIRGRLSVASSSGVVGTKGTAVEGPGGGGGPVTQPANVSMPGSLNSEMGCTDDWQPACDAAQMTRDPADDVWKKTDVTMTPGTYAYKIAINKAWDENYGAGGVRAGSDIPYTAPAGPVDFYFDYRTKNIQNTTDGPLVVAAGDFQSELGCPADWSPGCMRAWLGDPDKDGVYTWSGSGLPAGTYEFKIAYNLGWDENYGEDGTPNGANIAFTVPADGLTVQFRFDARTKVPTVITSQAASATDLTKAKAYWVSPGLLAWPAGSVPAGTEPGTLRWRLHAARNGGMTVDTERITSDQVYNLRYDPAGLPDSVVARYPYLKGYLAVKWPFYRTNRVRQLLQGQLAVGLYTDTQRLVDGTGVQIAPVVDSLYGRAARQTYGVDWSRARPTVRLWAPTARRVSVLTWPRGAAADAPATAARRVQMDAARDGSWSARVPLRQGSRYLFEVVVYVPSTGKVETNRVTDPYSVSLTLNSTRSVALDLSRRATQPAIWRRHSGPRLAQNVDTTIYELHVRDFSMTDARVPAEHRGSYLAFADDGLGSRHLRSLAAAGMNTVHLLPTFDIASIEEDPARQARPDCDLASLPPDSEQQQECIGKVADRDAFNWGYDPWHWMAPEGSYTSTPARADGAGRVREFRTMVGGLHRAGLRVVLDQVFNHTPTSGQATTSVLDKVVPGYYQRLNATGQVETSTCCQNVATENVMAEKIMVDATVLWAKHYHVDGFRFDLMGHHSRANMLAVRRALDRLTVRRDGIDGRGIYLYGEGWNFGEVANNARFVQATQGQLGGTGIGTFSDRLRDAVRGGGPFDELPFRQGLGSGLVTDPNGQDQGEGDDPAARLRNYTDLAQLGLAGNLRAYGFRSASGQPVTGAQVDYNGSPAGYADQPDEVITYVDAHDNETLFDELTYKLPTDTPMGDRVRMNSVALSFTALSQTPSFWHAGTDLLRSKSLDRNSYNSGDWFNRLDWTGADNGFGHGLPPKADNESKWPIQKPLLANPALKPTAAEVQTAKAQAAELLRLRFSTPLFRLGTAADIQAKVTFPVSGTPDARDGVIVMRVDDTVGRNADPALRNAVVVFNTTPEAVTQRVPGLAGRSLALSPTQAGGVDPVVKTSTWDAAAGTLTVPARTVAVFVEAG